MYRNLGIQSAALIAALFGIGLPVSADVFDDFEDGNYTANPEWVVVDTDGDAAVIADPLRPGNSVLRGYGDGGGQFVLNTDATMPLAGFDITFEMYVDETVLPLYDTMIRLEGSDPASEYVEFHILGAGGPDTTISFSMPHIGGMFGLSSDIAVDWSTVHLWHTQDSNQIHYQVDGAGGTAGFSGNPFSFDMVNSVSVGFALPGLQHVDNIQITSVPEPFAVGLVGSLSVFAFRRRGRTT